MTWRLIYQRARADPERLAIHRMALTRRNLPLLVGCREADLLRQCSFSYYLGQRVKLFKIACFSAACLLLLQAEPSVKYCASAQLHPRSLIICTCNNTTKQSHALLIT